MKLFVINYDGLWLGGKAIVFAENEKDALDQVRNDPTTVEFKNVKIEEVKAEGIIHNDNGDY